MNNQNWVFYFVFYDEDTDTNNVYGFVFAGPADESLLESDEFETLFDNIESKYGVHDWSTRPCDSIFAIGYTSYEIIDDQQIKCIEEWRQGISTLAGISNVSTYVKIDNYDATDDDYSLFNKIKNANLRT